MRLGFRPGLRWPAVLLAASIGCSSRKMPRERYGLDCIYDFRIPVTECARVSEQARVEPSLSEASELVLRSLTVTRSGSRLSIDAQLAGRFHNEADQNVYVFLGGPTADGAPATYALTADTSFAADFSFPVRSSLRLPHANSMRVGLMAPVERPYSPQVYVTDSVHADAVGPSAGVPVRVVGDRVQLEIPLDRYFALAKAPIPERLGVTVATARDYVGFVDQLSVRELPDSTTKTETARDSPPSVYPMLDRRSHAFERVALRTLSGGGVSVEIDMAAPIVDWAQTNLNFFFLPVPPTEAEAPLRDPSKAKTLPYRWSYYCGVYSPHRIFCKASRGTDFTYDTAYAERSALPPVEGVSFREIAPGRYALDLAAGPTKELSDPRATFALIVSAGRDGFGPTSWYGAGEPQR
jgi:hypothetical protein